MNLIKIANKLDKKGFHKQSDTIDKIIKKVSALDLGMEETPSDEAAPEDSGTSITDFFDRMLN
jgi:hypothetical protein